MTDLTLRVTRNGNHLDVDQSGNANQIAHGQTVTIIWQLTGNAASGSFHAIDDTPDSGFVWNQTPPGGVFDPPALFADGNQIRITDHNNDPNGVPSIGDWIYTLNATIQGQPCSTVYVSTRNTMTNPTIKNM